MTNELELAPADAPNIETLKRVDAPAIWQDFTAKLEPLEKESLAIVVTDASQLAIAKSADDKRKAVKALRCAVENKREELVAGMNKALGEINSEAREIKERCKTVEAHLQEQVDFAERAEAARLEKLKEERAIKLRAVGGDPAFYDLGKMSEEGFGQMIEGLEVAAQLKKERDAKAEAARIAAEQEAERLRAEKEKADAEERERQRVEVERLKAEAAEREAALRKEREERLAAERAADAARKAAEAKARAEREEIERAAEAERQAAAAAARAEAARVEKERAAERAKVAKEQAAKDAKAKAESDALAAKLKAEKEAREKIEAEQREREQAEAARLAAEKAAAEKAAKAPDREKLLAIAAKLKTVTLPSLGTKEGKAVLSDIIGQLEKKAGAL